MLGFKWRLTSRWASQVSVVGESKFPAVGIISGISISKSNYQQFYRREGSWHKAGVKQLVYLAVGMFRIQFKPNIVYGVPILRMRMAVKLHDHLFRKHNPDKQ